MKTIKIIEKDDGELGEILLATPPANVLTCQMMGEISEAIDLLHRDSRKKLIVISSEGKHFSFGASVEEHQPGQVGEMLPRFHQFIEKVLATEIPTLCKVRGLCLGGAFELALATTFLMVDEKAKFAVPEIKLGVFPPVAALLLPARVGEAHACELTLTGEQMGQEHPAFLKLINKVSPTGSLDADVDQFFTQCLKSKSASSLRMAHRASRRATLENYQTKIGGLERLYLEDLMSTRDAVEGIGAFIEKRDPKWSNS